MFLDTKSSDVHLLSRRIILNSNSRQGFSNAIFSKYVPRRIERHVVLPAIILKQKRINNNVIIIINIGNGIQCSRTGIFHDGYCIDAVASSDPNACQTILSEYAHPMTIKDQETQSAINTQFQGIHSYDLYKIGLTYSKIDQSFRWLDGTTLIFDNFESFPVIDDPTNICVALDRRDEGVWRSYNCDTDVYQLSTLCQIGNHFTHSYYAIFCN